MPSKTQREILDVKGREVAISNPSKVLFPEAGYTKLDLVRYYLAVADGALRAAQRAWIGYRDGQCTLVGFEARGGTMEPMLVSGCKATLTRARTKELRDFITLFAP